MHLSNKPIFYYIAAVYRNIPLLVLTVFICTSCSIFRKPYIPNKKYSPQQLQEDFRLMNTVLKANHPSLYWYTTKDSLDNYFSTTYNSLHDSLTEPQFRNKLAWYVSKIHCGHTSTRPSKGYAKYYGNKKLPLFPLNLKIWKDSAVVISNLLKKDSAIKRGNIITSINGFSTKQIIDSLCTLISTDGFSNNFKYQAFSFNFPSFYRNAFGTDSLYEISYQDNNGNNQTDTLQNFSPFPDTSANKGNTTTVKISPTENPLTKKQIKQLALTSARNLKIDTATHTAFLSVNTFSKGKLMRFFRKTFKQLKKDSILHVVIDLRLNTGGDVMASTKLCKYLAAKPFRIADTVSSVHRGMKYKVSIAPWFWYWWAMQFSVTKKDDGMYHFRYFERHQFKPKKNNHFDGNIYIITGGYTFSAASIFTNNLKGQSNVKIIGEETGGGSYGNSAIFIPDIVLPNTKLRVRLPLFRMVLNKNNPTTGRGIFPDVEVLPTTDFIRRGADAKMEKVKEMIKESENGK